MLGNLIKDLRLAQNLKLKELAARTQIDVTLLSRIEHGDRMPTKSQLELLADHLKVPLEKLRKEWLADKVVALVQYEPMAREVLIAAESRVEYLTSKKVHDLPELSDTLSAKLEKADHLRKAWKDAQPLGPSQLRRLQEYFDVAYTFESNRIEGNTLTLQETALVVNEGLTIGGKSMREHLEVINHAEAIEFVRGLVTGKEELTRRSVMEIHRLILKEVDNENAGRHRTVPVRISGSDTELPQPFLLDKLMEDYFEYYALHRRRLHPVILAAEMHERLVSIHPFVDGNGRTSRLVMNLILMQHGYTRANIKGDTQSRLNYYKALQSVQADANPEPFYHLVADEVINSLEQHLELV